MADEQIIYLSPEEELTSVRERLERIPTQRVILVIPAQTQLRSHVSWRLLHARVRELGKEVLIISSDRQIRSVVKAAGFRVTDSLESSPTSQNRGGSRTGRSILGGRTPSRVRTPPGQDVPGQRTNTANSGPDRTHEFEKRTSKPLDADSMRSQRDDSHFGPEINYSVPGRSTSSTPEPAAPSTPPAAPSIPSTPSIHPLEPSYQDEEPDLFLEAFRRARSILEAAQKNDPDRMVSPPPRNAIAPDSAKRIFDLPFEERADDDDVEFAPPPPTNKRIDSIAEQFGPYNIVRLLGQGDMGKVYFAEDSIRQSDGIWRKQSVAVKVLHKWYDKDMFRNHVLKMTKLQHDNILSTFLFGVKDDTPYLVMQYASKDTLLTRHPRGTILPLETILSYVKQIASALQYAHEREMLGDVRPKKMFVGKDNRILLSGFDIALNVGADPGRMVAKDYFEYRAPEQTQAVSSAACNQYALGIMAYEWLCGDVPFQGESVQIVYQHKWVTPPSLREKNPAIPHEVEEVVMKALAKDPEQRYESIQEFAEALEEAILPPKADRFVLPDRSGEQFGQYRLERLLGIGGFAEVYLGKHIKLDTFAAIKVLHTRLSVKELESFDKEAKVIASLRHPSIVRVLDYNAQGNIPFLVMDHAPEGATRQFHARGSRLSLPTVVKYVKQIAEALQFAHNKKIIHRDVKPENMLIESQDTIMLSDFGLAVIARSSRSARPQDKAGTAQYMAPEQFRGKPVPASDQYSLAVTAYEWLCGVPPFDEGNEIQLGYQHAHEPVPPMSERGSTVSKEVEQVILKALAKEPTERFGSVKEFADELEKAAQVD